MILPIDDAITFEPATPAAAESLLSLIHQLGHPISSTALLKNLKRNLSHPDYRIFTARQEHTIIGFAELHFTQFIHEEAPRARLTSFCIDVNHRNKKIGERFLYFMESFCKGNGISRMELTSNVRRADAHRFYEQHGYVFTSKRMYKEL